MKRGTLDPLPDPRVLALAEALRRVFVPGPAIPMVRRDLAAEAEAARKRAEESATEGGADRR